MGDVRKHFLKPLGRQFKFPEGAADDPSGWERDYVKVLQTFDDETLGNAAENIIATRHARSFPNPAECKSACRETIDAETIRRTGLESKSRTFEEIQAEKAHLGRLNTIAAEGDVNLAARLLIILSKSHKTRQWDFGVVDASVRYTAQRMMGIKDDEV